MFVYATLSYRCLLRKWDVAIPSHSLCRLFSLSWTVGLPCVENLAHTEGDNTGPNWIDELVLKNLNDLTSSQHFMGYSIANQVDYICFLDIKNVLARKMRNKQTKLVNFDVEWMKKWFASRRYGTHSHCVKRCSTIYINQRGENWRVRKFCIETNQTVLAPKTEKTERCICAAVKKN